MARSSPKSYCLFARMRSRAASRATNAYLVSSYAVLYRDEVRLHLLRRDEAPHGLSAPVQAQFWIDSELDDVFTRAESLGANVLQRPDARPWGHRDFMVADPDGNVVWVTTPIVSTAG